MLSKLVQAKRITDEGLWVEPPAAGRFFVIFWKKSYYNALESHFAHVQSHLQEQNF